MLNISDLHVSYGKRAILHGVSLSCQPGKITVIIGPNGCGKSTMLKAIAGVTPMERGEIGVLLIWRRAKAFLRSLRDAWCCMDDFRIYLIRAIIERKTLQLRNRR